MANNQTHNSNKEKIIPEDESERRLTTKDAQDALFSKQFADLYDAMERLYVFSNMSGRLIFMRNWPLIADQIFHEQLKKYDTEGAITEEDKKEREALEIDADVKREEFVTLFAYMQTELVKDGTVDLEKLEFVMQKFDRDTCLLLFTERFVNRYHPAPEDKEVNTAAETFQSEQAESEKIPKVTHDDTLSVDNKPTGNVHVPPPASKSNGNNQDYKNVQRPRPQAQPPAEHIPEHIGHADHSLSQTLTANQHEETDLFNDNYVDPMDEVMPIDMGSAQAAQSQPPTQETGPEDTATTAAAPASDHIAPDTSAPDAPSVPDEITPPAADHAAPHAPAQTQPASPKPDASSSTSAIKPIAPKARLEERDENKPAGQTWQPGPGIIKSDTPLDDNDDKPLFVANIEKGEDLPPPPASSTPSEDDKPLFVADSEAAQHKDSDTRDKPSGEQQTPHPDDDTRRD